MDKIGNRMRIKGIILMMMIVMGCNSGGGVKGEGEARKADGSVIDLKVVSKKIRDAVEFAEKVKEVHVLVKSVEELAKAIGKKIDANGSLTAEADHNGSLLAGVHSVISALKTKLKGLETTDNISDELKVKIVAVGKEGKAFLDKLKEKKDDLGKEGAKDTDAKSAIDVTDNTKDKGATELAKLNGTIDELLKASNRIVSDVIAELVVNPTT
ncbi:Vsp/OspC family lipoprotein [Borrelia crocidurae]|uniref:Vsp protein n=1 Tax=Borrelia crocidurae (strain Achema) TaxID=1155096 RepID=I0FFB7_BORCA|nr:Vsp/OspC family lipoprotein [Borrelia crocidurae]AFI32173.1 Vsp protein [Borrelia crocidurae str. Achema]